MIGKCNRTICDVPIFCIFATQKGEEGGGTLPPRFVLI